MLERAGGAPRALPGSIEEGALLVVDVQGDFADPDVLGDLSEASRAAVANAVEEVLALVDSARASGLEVIWIRGRESDPPWGSVLWLLGREGREDEGAGVCVPGSPGHDFWRVAPRDGEVIVTKERYSGFVRTNLEEILLDHGRRWVAVCGLTTECCVASTAWDAIQRDFRVVVVGDASAAYDEGMHTAALESMAESVGIVVSAHELGRALRAAGEGPESRAP
jgi:ureidoacrylate peracid hydrolase